MTDEPVEPTTLKQFKQLQTHTEYVSFDDAQILDMLAHLGLVEPADVVKAAKLVKERGEVFQQMRDARKVDEKQYSDAVNEVFNETGEHWID
jgi:hypothetical protein